MLARSVRLALLLMALALVPATAAQAATIWTPIASGTTGTISAIAAPSASEVVFVTTGGQIRRLSGGSFVAATVNPLNATGFTDVAMSPDGTKGVAVGASGKIYNSTDSGATWNKILTTPTEFNGACPSPGAPTMPLGDDLFSVKFADANTVYVTGQNDDVLRSTDGGASFLERNKSALACVANPGGSAQAFTDSYWADANDGLLISNNFGQIFQTANGFTTATGKGNIVPNGFTYRDQLAVDAGDFNHFWAISGGAMNGSYFQFTVNGGTTMNTPTYDGNQVGLQDIATTGGTTIAVGQGGDIYTSTDGRNFIRQVADAPNNTIDWRGVALVNASTAYVAGVNGTLLVSTKANSVPDTTPPTGSISGPSKLAIGQFGTYTANVTDNPGGSGVDPASFVWSTPGLPNQTGTPAAKFAFSTAGSHVITVAFKDLAGNANTAKFTVSVTQAGPTGSSPTTTKTGGAKVTIFKHVTVKGRKGRFIPVTLSTKKPRKFAITLLSVSKKHPKTFAKLTVTIAKGTKTVHLAIPNKVKSGSYRLIVKVFTTGKRSHQTGKSVKQVFVLT